MDNPSQQPEDSREGSSTQGNWRRSGVLLVVSGPSGTGKTTLCERLRTEFNIVYSVSCTTREPRPGEEEGKQYYFLSRVDFAEREMRGEFLEHAEVHGNYYGTLRQPVVDALEGGQDVLMEIDTKGARQIRESSDPTISRALTDVFIMPPSLDELKARLQRRASETADQMAQRLLNARGEMKDWASYQFTIISGKHEEDYQQFSAIFLAARQRSDRQAPPGS
jgi:guanylate kinase